MFYLCAYEPEIIISQALGGPQQARLVHWPETWEAIHNLSAVGFTLARWAIRQTEALEPPESLNAILTYHKAKAACSRAFWSCTRNAPPIKFSFARQPARDWADDDDFKLGLEEFDSDDD